MDTRASRPVSALEDPSVVADILDALAVNLNGKPAAPGTSPGAAGCCTAPSAYAVRKKRLSKNPLSKTNLPEGWTPPEAPDDTVDPRAVGSPALVAPMLEACGTIGKRQGPRFRAFYGCMFYALMRPSEVAALTREGCHLPETGWGHLIFADSSPAAGQGLHRRRPGPRAPRPQRPHQGQAHPEGPQARPEGPDPARARRAPARRTSTSSAWPRTGGCSAPRTATRSSPPPGGRSGRKSGPPRSPPAAGLAADEAPLRPAALRGHLAAQLGRARHRGRRLGRALASRC